MRILQKIALLVATGTLLLSCALSDQLAELVVTPVPTAVLNPVTAPVPPGSPTVIGALVPTATRAPGSALEPTWTATLVTRPTTAPITATPTLTTRPTAAPSATPVPTLSFGSSSDAFSAGMLARRNGDYVRASLAFQAALTLKPPADLARQAQFRLGEAYRLAGDDEHALAALNAYLQSYPAGEDAPAAHYFLADVYSRVRKDYSRALTHLRAFRDQTKTLGGETDALIADALARSGDSAGAIAQYDRALQDTTLSPSTRISILLRTGAVHLGRGEPARAAARYDTALTFAKDAHTRAALNLSAGQAYAAANQMDLAISRWASVIVDTPEQLSARQALVELTNRGARIDELQRGLVELNEGNDDTAIAAFTRYLSTGGARAGEAHYQLALAYTDKSAYSQAIVEYDTIINNFPKDNRVPDAFMGKASAELAIGKLDEAVSVYQRFVSVLPDATRAAEALYRAGMVLERTQRYRDAAVLFDRLQSTYPARDEAAKALFRAGLDYHRILDDQTALARWQLIVQRYRSSDYYTGALYWMGKVAAARGQKDTANGYWRQAAALAPEVFKTFRRTYYAYRSRALISPVRPAEPKRVYDPSRYVMDSAAARPEFERWLAGWTKTDAPLGNLDATIRSDLRFRRGEELLQLDRVPDARNEFSALADAQNDAPTLYALARYFQEKELYSLSIASADRIALLAMVSSALPAPRGLMLLRFPTYYADLVVPESQANHIDPLLYFSVLRLESHFDPWATGPVVERGLAQINPQVAPAIVDALKITDFDPEQLYRPYLNVRMGNWLFAQNSTKVDDPIYAIAAYNAGLAAVLSWQEPDIDMAVEDFDVDFARVYVNIVWPNWIEYQLLYR